MNTKYDYENKIKQLSSIAISLFVVAVFLLPVCYITGWFSKSAEIFFIILIVSMVVIGIALLFRESAYKKELELFEVKELQRINTMRIEQEERKARERTELINLLNNIPKADIDISDNKIKNNAVKDMGEIKYSRPRNGQPLSKYSSFVVVDIETTGIKVTEKIVEISAIRYDGFKPISAFTTLLDPEKPIPPEASKINNITDDMVDGKPTFKSIIPSLERFIGNSNLVGQNLMFDLKFLYKYGYDFTCVDRKYYDTLDIAKSKLTKYDYRKDNDPDYYYDVDDYKLSTLCEYYNVHQINAHRALGDCLATAQVFERMLRQEYNLKR